jgi:hypothetical protein
VRTPAQTDVANFWAQASLAGYIPILRGLLAQTGGRPLGWQVHLVATFHEVTGRSITADTRQHNFRKSPISVNLVEYAQPDHTALLAGDRGAPLVQAPRAPSPIGRPSSPEPSSLILENATCGPTPPRRRQPGWSARRKST